MFESSEGSRDLGDNFAQEADELGFHAFGGFEDFVVVGQLVENAGGGVGNAGNAEGAEAGVARGDDFGSGGHANEIGADGAKIADFGGCFVAGAGEGGVYAFAEIDVKAAAGGESEFAEFLVVRVGHVGEARAEFIGVGAGEGVGALQIDVIADDDEASLGEFFLDAAGGVGEDDGFDAEAGKNANGKGDVLRRVAFVEMDAALHASDFDAVDLADDELAGVADSGGAGEVRDFCVGDPRGAGELVSEGAEAGAEDERDFRTQLGFFLDEARGCFGAGELCICVSRGRTFCGCAHVRIPTMQADIRLAMVPASMARMPNLASWPRCSGARAPMPPIWMPMELKFAKPQRAKVAMVKVRGSSASFISPRCWKATTSLMTMRVPRRLPISAQSRQGIPMSHATGAKTQPKTCERLEGNHVMCRRGCVPSQLWTPPMTPLTRYRRAMKEMSMAATLRAR